MSRGVLEVVVLATLASAATAAHSEEWEYTVKTGDSLWSLGEKYLNNPEQWGEVKKHNNVPDADRIEPGDTLLIPVELLRMEPAAALVDGVFGMATVTTGVNKRPVEAGMLLESGDTLTTLAGATVTVVFEDDTEVLVEGGAVIEFREIRGFTPASIGSQKIELKKGGVETSIPQDKTQLNRFYIRTTAAELRARGTVYRVRVGDLTIAETLEGKVSISSAGTEKNIGALMGTRAEVGKEPEEPRPLPPPPDIEHLVTNITSGPIRFSVPLDAGIAAHRVQYAKDETFRALLFDGTTETAELPVPDLANGDYVLRVRAVDETGLEGSNAIHRFTLAARPLIYLRLPEKTAPPPPTELPEYFRP